MKVKSSAWTILPSLSLLAWAGPLGPLAPQVPPFAAPREVSFGFSPASYAIERGWEEKYLALPNAARCGKYLKQLTAFPHIAGTPGDRRVTELIYQEFERDGLKPDILEYKVLLSYPKKIEIEIAAPERVKLATPEPVIPGDKQTRLADPLA